MKLMNERWKKFSYSILLETHIRAFLALVFFDPFVAMMHHDLRCAVQKLVVELMPSEIVVADENFQAFFTAPLLLVNSL